MLIQVFRQPTIWVHIMPGRGGKGGAGLKPKKKAFKPKLQKKRFIRSKDPILAVLMWGVEHSVSFINSFLWGEAGKIIMYMPTL